MNPDAVAELLAAMSARVIGSGAPDAEEKVCSPRFGRGVEDALPGILEVGRRDRIAVRPLIASPEDERHPRGPATKPPGARRGGDGGQIVVEPCEALEDVRGERFGDERRVV